MLTVRASWFCMLIVRDSGRGMLIVRDSGRCMLIVRDSGRGRSSADRPYPDRGQRGAAQADHQRHRGQVKLGQGSSAKGRCVGQGFQNHFQYNMICAYANK